MFWGDPELQGLHIGLFIALVALIVFWVLLNRSVAGYEARAVGFNPDAAEYGGIHAGRTYVKVMLWCGGFAGLAGAIDVLGWQFHVATNDLQNASVIGAGFIGIAVALLGRNTATGVLFSALLFGALINGTSVRNLDPAVFPPELATNLTLIIQGLIVLLVSAPVIVTTLYRLRPRRSRPAESRARWRPARDRRDRHARAARPHAASSARPGPGWGGVALGILAWWIALPPLLVRSPMPSIVLALVAIGLGAWTVREGARRLGWGAVCRGRDRRDRRGRGDAVGRGEPRGRRRLVGAGRGDAALRDAAGVRRARRRDQRARGRREHRPRGHDADGRVLRDLRRGPARRLVRRGCCSAWLAGGALA